MNNSIWNPLPDDEPEYTPSVFDQISQALFDFCAVMAVAFLVWLVITVSI